MQRLALNFKSLGQMAAIALAFMLPISTSMTSVLMALILFAWILAKDHSQKWRILWQHPAMKWVYPYILLTIVGTFYSIGDNKEIINGLTDALRLMLIPILIYFYQSPKVTRFALWAFTLAMIVTLIFAFLKVYAGFPIGLKYTTGAVFKSHIKTSFFMSIAAFYLAYQIKFYPRYSVLLISLVALMVYYLLFMSVGRIGYITIVVLALFLAWQRYQLKGLLGSFMVVSALICTAYLTSNVFSARINLLSQDLDFYHQGGRLLESSLGSRIHFADTSLDLITAKPLYGWGTGGYGAAYAKMHEGENTLLTDNPHNEYLRAGAELGILGLILLLLMFTYQWRLMGKLPLEQKGLFQGMMLVFMIGCLLNSWLKDSSEGIFYCLMIAASFASLPLPEEKFLVKDPLH